MTARLLQSSIIDRQSELSLKSPRAPLRSPRWLGVQSAIVNHPSHFVFLLLFLIAVPAAPQRPAQLPTVSSGSAIHPPPAGYQFPNGLTLVFQAEWRLWTAGTARFTLEDAGQNMQRITGTAESAGFVSSLYPVHDRFQSVFDRRSFCSQSINKHAEEGFHKRETLINFNYTRNKAILDETNLKDSQVKHVEFDIPNCVTDVLSGMFYVAAQRLNVGDSYMFPLNDGNKTLDVTVHVEAKEQVKVPSGTYNTIRVAPQASAGVLKDRGRVWIWYTDDARHLPVQMRARMLWGTLTFKLASTEQK
jgi:Protein of unknown function (DUF3108)